MNPPRPQDSAPGGMRGSQRMHDPTETAHDRVRRRVMNVAFLALVAASAGHLFAIGVRGGEWLTVLLLILAAVPLGLVVKVFELRFKMADEERRRALAEVPRSRQLALGTYALLVVVAAGLNPALVSWAFWGVWGYDFVTYYHDRPERMRHLYAVTMILEELRELPAPWAWPLPALAWSVWRG